MRRAAWSDVSPVAARASGSVASNTPSGTKYMFAMLCSNPAAMKADAGSTIPASFSIVVRPAVASRIAMHTRMFARMPRTKAVSMERFTLASAATMAVPAKQRSPYVHQWP